MLSVWNGPINFRPGTAGDELSITTEYPKLKSTPGVYVYIIRPHDKRGIIHAYGGKAQELEWRMVQHATSTLRLMYALYDGAGTRVLPPEGDDEHMLHRLAAMADACQGWDLGHWQSVAREQLRRMEFWAVEFDKPGIRDAEAVLVGRLKDEAEERPDLNCINGPRPSLGEAWTIPQAPDDSLLRTVLG